MAAQISLKEQLEENILLTMEEVDAVENKFNEYNSFVKGVASTLEDLKSEVNEQIANENKEISNYQKRIDSLLTEIPLPIKNMFIALNKKYRFNSPWAQ
ncbi:MAG: hypothetical protein HQK51_21550 [Oligoflexia bacterium]|nr:hypothetical protein [Oligoflexia bacterium]